ncbi:YlmC/YmxH family sporulation protein [Brockia lithotrophica]|uniref:YlmC/YmxH family sporulation protein n=1 Tax=Brockia lithotrophica TaxID=933949 RepID=UPI001B879C61
MADVLRISEFQSKDVVRLSDGKRLGRVADVEIDPDAGRVLALIVPKSGGMFSWFRRPEETVVRWEDIETIGVDVILVRTPDSPASRLPEGKS